MTNILVLGLGSVLMGDDAVGPWAIRLLENGYEMPPEVTLLDLGTPGPELAHYVTGLDALIVLDSVKHSRLPAGSVVEIRDGAIQTKLAAPRLSPHDPSLRDALLSAELLGGPPKSTVLFGVIPERVKLGTGLTPAVAAALPKLVDAVLAELAALGFPARKLTHPAEVEPTVWWEQAAS